MVFRIIAIILLIAVVFASIIWFLDTYQYWPKISISRNASYEDVVEKSLPGSDISDIHPNVTSYIPLLFENIRFGQMPVKFYLDLASSESVPWFTDANIKNVIEAFETWENASNKISFERTFDEIEADVLVKWTTNLNATNTTRVVGEGGPKLLIDTGLFNMTIKATMNMLPTRVKCVDVNRAVHELGHVLGFDHTSDPSDIMYPYESCSRKINQNEIDSLENMYALDAKPQLHMYNVSVSVNYGYLDVDFNVKNIGLLNSPKTEAALLVDGKEVAKININILEPGSGFSQHVKNAKIIYGSGNLDVVIDPESKIDMWYRNLTYVNVSLA